MKSNILQIVVNKAVTLIALFILSTSISMASIVYTYIGNNYGSGDDFYDSSTTNRIDISFTTDSLITTFKGNAGALVKSYNFFNGISQFTEANSYSSF